MLHSSISISCQQYGLDTNFPILKIAFTFHPNCLNAINTHKLKTISKSWSPYPFLYFKPLPSPAMGTLNNSKPNPLQSKTRNYCHHMSKLAINLPRKVLCEKMSWIYEILSEFVKMMIWLTKERVHLLHEIIITLLFLVQMHRSNPEWIKLSTSNTWPFFPACMYKCVWGELLFPLKVGLKNIVHPLRHKSQFFHPNSNVVNGKSTVKQ